MSEKNKTHLGDGLYAFDEGYQIELTAGTGYETQVVYLDDYVLEAFLKFVAQSRGLKITVDKVDK